jgi:hypothetical protein
MTGEMNDEDIEEETPVTGKKQPRETGKAIAAFAVYCEMGPNRSLVKLQVELTKREQYAALKTIKWWSRTFGWQKRVLDYDMTMAAERRAALDKAIEDMNKRHIMLAVNQQLKMGTLIDDLIKRKKFGSLAATTLLKLALDLERLARGAPTEQTKMDVGFDQTMPLVIKTTWDRALVSMPNESEDISRDGDEEEEAQE